jgi:hypothetical protein
MGAYDRMKNTIRRARGYMNKELTTPAFLPRQCNQSFVQDIAYMGDVRSISA